MHTIKEQLQEIKVLALKICEISENYKMGFITISEMLYQIQNVDHNIECIKSSIRNEYGINETAIDLMLQM
jgi:hypothetical protein